jgi:hypothetical protein
MTPGGISTQNYVNRIGAQRRNNGISVIARHQPVARLRGPSRISVFLHDAVETHELAPPLRRHRRHVSSHERNHAALPHHLRVACRMRRFGMRKLKIAQICLCA